MISIMPHFNPLPHVMDSLREGETVKISTTWENMGGGSAAYLPILHDLSLQKGYQCNVERTEWEKDGTIVLWVKLSRPGYGKN